MPLASENRHDLMEQGPTEPHAGRSTFLLSSGGAGGAGITEWRSIRGPTTTEHPCVRRQKVAQFYKDLDPVFEQNPQILPSLPDCQFIATDCRLVRSGGHAGLSLVRVGQWPLCAQALLLPLGVPPTPAPHTTSFPRRGVWRVHTTTSDVSNATQGRGVLDHQALGSGEQRVQAFCRLCALWFPLRWGRTGGGGKGGGALTPQPGVGGLTRVKGGGSAGGVGGAVGGDPPTPQETLSC